MRNERHPDSIRGGQHDQAEIAIAEQQIPVNGIEAAAIRYMVWRNQRPGEGNNDKFPEAAGRTGTAKTTELPTVALAKGTIDLVKNPSR